MESFPEKKLNELDEIAKRIDNDKTLTKPEKKKAKKGFMKRTKKMMKWTFKF